MDAVLAGVLALIDVAFFLQQAEQFLCAALVPGFGGADEIVIGDVHPVKERAVQG